MMFHSTRFRIAALLALLALLALPAVASTWSHDSLENDLVSDTGAIVAYTMWAIHDKTGGLYIVWVDDRIGGGIDNAYVMRVAPDGSPSWTTDGLLVYSALDRVSGLEAAVDDAGNLYLAVADHEYGSHGVWGQKVQPDGSLPWGSGGVNVDPGITDNSELDPVVAPDGQGGCVVAWRDLRDQGTSDSDIYAQRIDAGGSLLWGDDGLQVCGEADTQWMPSIVFTGDGVVIAWEDERAGSNNYDIYADKLDLDGVSQWAAGGEVFCDDPSDQRNLHLVAGVNGEVLMVWKDVRTYGLTGDDIYGQRIRGDGSVVWDLNGGLVCGEMGDQDMPRIASDGTAGAYIVWRDDRGIDIYDDPVLYAQRLDGSGSPRWTAGGVPAGGGDGS